MTRRARSTRVTARVGKSAAGPERVGHGRRLPVEAGNRSVARLFGSAPAVQRKVPYSSIDQTDEDAVKVAQVIKDFDTSVNNAHAAVTHKPALGALSNVDGHISHWQSTWQAYLDGESPPLPAAAFGYAVESVTDLVYRPSPPGGMKIQVQQARGATRPDFVVSKEGKDVAWIDVTAWNSKGHIFDKTGWDRVPNYAEVTYPSTTMEEIKTISGSKEAETFDYGDIDIEAVKERLKRARHLQAHRRKHWAAMGLVFFKTAPKLGNVLTRDAERRRYVATRLNNLFGTSLDMDVADHQRIAGSVLVAMRRTPTSYGFVDYSVSRSQGESYLLEHDHTLAQSDAVFDLWWAQNKTKVD